MPLLLWCWWWWLLLLLLPLVLLLLLLLPLVLLLLPLLLLMLTTVMVHLLLLAPCICLTQLVRDAKVPATCSQALAAFLQQQQAGQAQQEQDKEAADQRKQQPFSSFLATVLMLMGELAQGPASKHDPYFKTLPHKTSCLMNWTQQERALLKGDDAALKPAAFPPSTAHTVSALEHVF